MKYLISIFITNLLIVPFIFGQNDNINFEHISIDQGLSQSSVNWIVQDSIGFLWFATENGLNRYDGYDFKIYVPDEKNPFSLSNNIIWSIFEDKAGVLWIGTFKGLNRFDTKKEIFTQYLYDVNDSTSLNNNFVKTILRDKYGVLWIGTDGGGLEIFDEKNNHFIHHLSDPSQLNSLSNNSINTLFSDKNGTLWIGTEDGLNKYNREQGNFTQYRNIPNNNKSINNNRIKVIFEDSSGLMWIGTEGGLNIFYRNKEEFVSYTHKERNTNSITNNYITSIFEYHPGKLWIGTFGGGINILDVKKEKFHLLQSKDGDLNNVSSKMINHIIEDRTSIIWIGTEVGGINKYSRKKEKITHYKNVPNNPNSISSNIVRPILEDRFGFLWIGTEGAGLNKVDRENHIFTRYNNFPNNPNSLSYNFLRAIYEDSQGNLWIGTDGGGLNKFNRKNETFIHYKHNSLDSNSISNNKVRAIIESEPGILWIGTYGGGLNKFDLENQKFKCFKNNPDNSNSLSYDNIFTIYKDKSGILWIGTHGGGLNRFDPDSEKFTQYKFNPNDSTSISYDLILSIHEDQQGNLWIGTDGKGLNRLDREKDIFYHYGKKEGLPDEVIYGILEDDHGNLWISHNKGIIKFNPFKKINKNYSKSDGLQSDEFNGSSYFQNKKGEMFFGGINGVNVFYPDSLIKNDFIPSIIFTDFKLNNKSVPIGKAVNDRIILSKTITYTKEIELSYKDNIFSFEFAALDYSSPLENKYSYILEGVDLSWTDIGTRHFIPYTNMLPGIYILKIKAANSDNRHNEKIATIKIKIDPPWWKTGWFYLVAIITVLFAVYAFIKNREDKLKKDKQILEHTVELRTKDIAAKNKILEAQKEELAAQRDALADANNTKDKFFSIISHDLKSPFNSLLGFAELIIENFSSLSQDKIEKYTNQIYSSAKQLYSLVENLLAWSRSKRDMIKIYPESFNLHNIIEAVYSLSRITAEKKQIKIAYEINEDITVYADENLVATTIRNLLSNAIKYSTENSTIKILIKSENGYAKVSVRDKGIGIKKEDLDKLFREDFHFTTKGTNNEKGTGLGLILCKEFAEKNGGEIWVESVFGKGTTFTFTIPLLIENIGHNEPSESKDIIS